jgi:catechol-2,3-dioxygenase
MVRFEHANLVVNEIERTLQFIQTAFPSWAVRGQGEMQWQGKTRRWLHVGNDDYYITLNDGAQEKNRFLKGHSAGLAHLGFVVDDIEEVIKRLQESDYSIDVNLADHAFRKNVYFVDPEGFQFEFVQYFSEFSHEKNTYESSENIQLNR